MYLISIKFLKRKEEEGRGEEDAWLPSRASQCLLAEWAPGRAMGAPSLQVPLVVWMEKMLRCSPDTKIQLRKGRF